MLARKESRTAGGAALVTVGIGEKYAFIGDPVDIRGFVPHDAPIVGADVEWPDVIALDYKDVGFICCQCCGSR